MRGFVDLGHTVEYRLVADTGLPAPVIYDYSSGVVSKEHYVERTSFHIGTIEVVASTGTYIDFPFYRYEKGKDLLEFATEALVEIGDSSFE